jgi:hypothetical protein
VADYGMGTWFWFLSCYTEMAPVTRSTSGGIQEGNKKKNKKEKKKGKENEERKMGKAHEVRMRKQTQTFPYIVLPFRLVAFFLDT